MKRETYNVGDIYYFTDNHEAWRDLRGLPRCGRVVDDFMGVITVPADSFPSTFIVSLWEKNKEKRCQLGQQYAGISIGDDHFTPKLDSRVFE